MGEFLELLLDRRSTRPESRDDGARIALVIEGGGMRGVVGAGAACALRDLGIADCFDDVYGVSAGALTAAYLVAGCSLAATPIYWETLLPARFLSPARALRGGPVMNLDYLIDEALTNLVPLDEAAIASNPVRLHVIASSLDARRAVDLDASHGPLRDRLRASARVPLCSGGPVRLGGERFIDGCVFEPLPVARAIADGATHVLVLRTLPRMARRRGLLAVTLDDALRVRHPQLRGSAASSCGRYLQQLDDLDAWDEGGQVWALAPSGQPLRTYCRSAAALADGANRGYAMVCDALGAPAAAPFSVSDSLTIPSAAPVRALGVGVGAGVGAGGLALAASLRLRAARRTATVATTVAKPSVVAPHRRLRPRVPAAISAVVEQQAATVLSGVTRVAGR